MEKASLEWGSAIKMPLFTLYQNAKELFGVNENLQTRYAQQDSVYELLMQTEKGAAFLKAKQAFVDSLRSTGWAGLSFGIDIAKTVVRVTRTRAFFHFSWTQISL